MLVDQTALPTLRTVAVDDVDRAEGRRLAREYAGLALDMVGAAAQR